MSSHTREAESHKFGEGLQQINFDGSLKHLQLLAPFPSESVKWSRYASAALPYGWVGT